MDSELKIIIKKWKGLNPVESDLNLLNLLLNSLDKLESSIDQFGFVGYQISSFTKLLCDPWMENQTAFDEIYYQWENYLLSIKTKVGGMTVNERLCYFGLMDEFEKSGPGRKETILQEVFIDEETISKIIN